MLKLIYHNVVFGPIDLEYAQPVIRVGRNEDNDLVLRHHSIEPYHCLLIFRGEKLLCLPPMLPLPAAADLPRLVGQEFGAGDQLVLGELEFGLAHSSRSIDIPGVEVPDSDASLTAPEEPVPEATESSQLRFYCGRCQASFAPSEIKSMGLVGRAKLNLCPQCRGLLEVQS